MKLKNKGEIWRPIKAIHFKHLEDLDDWEDYEEPKEHWHIRDGEVYRSEIGPCIKTEKRKEIGNYFETKEEAEKAVEKLKAWKRLKDKGFKLNAVIDDFFCLDIYIKGKQYEEIKEDLKLIFGGEE